MSAKQPMTKTGKWMVGIAAVIFVAIIVLVAIVAYQSRQENKKFLKEGLRSQASILDKFTRTKYRRKGGNQTDYYFKIALFADTVAPDTHKAVPKSNKIEDKIDAMFENIKTKPLGKFVMKEVETGNTTYAKHKTGDRITVVYLKENPENLKILEDIE